MSEPPSTSKARAPRGPVRRPRATSEAAGGQGPAAPGAAVPAAAAKRRPVGPRKQPRLGETPGPDPATPVEAVRLKVGTIVGPFGVRGEAKLRLTTDDPEHLTTIKQVWVGDEPTPRRLLGIRFHKEMGLIRLQGVATPEAVDALRGEPVRIAGADARPLAPGEHFLFQLVGLEAFDEAGNRLGRVADIMETGANDVLVVAPEGGGPDILLPNHPEVVLEIRPEAGRMTVRPLRYGD